MVPLIDIRNLTYRYPGASPEATPALNGITLQIQRGEIVAIVGANGSGKSTLAKHFNALLVPTDGDVIVDGLNTRDPATIWQVRQRVGMVFQNPDNQLVATLVEEDVAFGPENLGVPPAEIAVRVQNALQAVDMLPYRKHEPHLLSGGQKQRVAIAGILAMRPQCVVLDEATTMLDPAGQREVMETIARLNDEGITVLHITHSMEEAATCRRVIALSAGRVALDGPPEEVFAHLDVLERLRLAAPPIRILAAALLKAGVPIPERTLTLAQLEDSLVQLATARMQNGGADGPH